MPLSLVDASGYNRQDADAGMMMEIVCRVKELLMNPHLNSLVADS